MITVLLECMNHSLRLSTNANIAINITFTIYYNASIMLNVFDDPLCCHNISIPNCGYANMYDVCFMILLFTDKVTNASLDNGIAIVAMCCGS